MTTSVPRLAVAPMGHSAPTAASRMRNTAAKPASEVPRRPGSSGYLGRRLPGAVSHWSALLFAAVLTGCCTCPPPPAPPHAYVGPTESIDVVVQRVNANAQRVPSLWSQLDYAATFYDPQKKQATNVSGDGVLNYRRPASLDLTGFKDVAGTVFDLGCDGTEFWVKVRTGADSNDYFWGRLANVGKSCCQRVPIRPDLVTQVLGVGQLQTDLLQQPAPVMRFDNEADAYVFDFNVRRPDRWVTQKEVWYDRQDCLPRRVLLYDDAGRIVVRAELSRHAPVDVPGVAADRRPVLARHYDLRFPDTGSTMSLDLTDPALTHALKRTVIPNDATFNRPPPDDGDHVVQVDAACGSKVE